MSEWATRRNLVAVDLGTEWLAAGSTARRPETLTDGDPRLLNMAQPWWAATTASMALTAVKSPTMRLRMTATATPESMSA